jgi:hypothetical protein
LLSVRQSQRNTFPEFNGNVLAGEEKIVAVFMYTNCTSKEDKKGDEKTTSLLFST